MLERISTLLDLFDLSNEFCQTELEGILLNEMTEFERDIINLRLGIGYERRYTVREVARIGRTNYDVVAIVEMETVRRLDKHGVPRKPKE